MWDDALGIPRSGRNPHGHVLIFIHRQREILACRWGKHLKTLHAEGLLSVEVVHVVPSLDQALIDGALSGFADSADRFLFVLARELRCELAPVHHVLKLLVYQLLCSLDTRGCFAAVVPGYCRVLQVARLDLVGQFNDRLLGVRLVILRQRGIVQTHQLLAIER